MRTASAGRAPAGAGPRRAAAAELTRAVRTVDRWALVVGATGLLANVLLVVLLTTPADGPYAWTGPANDVVGDVSTLATIPVAWAGDPGAEPDGAPHWPSRRTGNAQAFWLSH